MEKKINRVYIKATEDNQKGVIETLEKWGGKNLGEFIVDNIQEDDYWFIDEDGEIDLGVNNYDFSNHTQIQVGQMPEEKIEANNDETLINALAEVDRLTKEVLRLEQKIKSQANDINAKDEHFKERNKEIDKLHTEAERNEKVYQGLLEKYDVLQHQVQISEATKPKKLPMYKGDKKRGEEVIKALEDAGGKNEKAYKGTEEDTYYYLRDDKLIVNARIDYFHNILSKVFELKELPKKKEVVEFSLKQRESFLGRMNKLCNWGVDAYNKFDNTSNYPVLGYSFRYSTDAVLPLKGNEHLIGTIDNPDKEYKFVTK